MGSVARHLAVVTLVGIVASGCAPPVGYRPIGPREAYRDLTASVLSGTGESVFSRQFLARLGLGERFRKEPEIVLRELHGGLGGPDEQDRLFVLSELSLSHAEASRDPSYFLAAAVYAYTFLFPPDPAHAPERFDPRLGLALDMYQRGLVAGLATGDDARLDLSARTIALPFGTLSLRLDAAERDYGGYQLERFVSTRDLRVRGLRNAYRRAGLGAQLAVKLGKPADPRAVDPWISPTATVAVTLVLRFDDVREGLATGRVGGRIELDDPDVSPRVCVEGQAVPLEFHPSSVLAYGLEGSPLWDFEIAGFRRADLAIFEAAERTGLFMMRPYHRGRIPVVFVHGTASSPARWAEMVNELLADTQLAPRYQFWFFIYNTGNAAAYSATRLRKALTRVVTDVDPNGRDSALQQMVVIGHSQGGLIAKMMVVRTGDRIWDAFYDVTFDEKPMPTKTRELLRDAMFFEPVPSVKRVVFIATPHRGSFLARNWLGGLARRLIHLPADLSRAGAQLLELRPRIALPRTRITSIDSMDPRNPTLRVLAELPLAERVRGHSIIAVKGNGPIEDGNDGIVEYRSAHLDGMDSELVVRAPHSCQGDPETIEEVRRILRVHLQSLASEAESTTMLAADPCAAVTSKHSVEGVVLPELRARDRRPERNPGTREPIHFDTGAVRSPHDTPCLAGPTRGRTGPGGLRLHSDRRTDVSRDR